MKIINVGNLYQIYTDELRTYDSLPADVYSVRFQPMQGFSLVSREHLSVSEKIYGDHLSKIEKTIRRFDHSSRSLGVLLSGEKGIGKSMFANALSEKMVARGVPVIVVDKAYEGIADFLSSIQQEVMILFDEFEKTFPTNSDRGRELGLESQSGLLGLFDGMSAQKRMYVVTLNELHKVSNYILNRPGRFHYHFRFQFPEGDEVREYLEDNVSQEYHNEIHNAVKFSARVPLNYDCLRAVASELNFGSSFAEAITDLNIINVEKVEYLFTIEFSNGVSITTELFINPVWPLTNIDSYDLSTPGDDWFRATIDMDKLVYEDGLMAGDKDVIKNFEVGEDNEHITEGVEVSRVTFKAVPNKAIGYSI